MRLAAPRPGSRTRWLPGLAIVVAAVTVTLPTSTAGPDQAVLAGVVLLTLTAGALGARSTPTVRALVFLDVVFAVFAAGSLGGWPPAMTAALVCVLPVAALLACGRVA